MAFLTFGVSAAQFVDLPSQVETGMETAVNTLLASLLTHSIDLVAFSCGDTERSQGYDLRLLVGYSSGAAAIGTPYLVKGFIAKNAEDMANQVTAFIALNPGYFYSGVFTAQVAASRRQNQLLGLMVYNTVLANGQQNWFVGGNSGGPAGPAGGDLSGLYPNPSVFAGQLSAAPGAATTAIDAQPIATYKTVVWEVEAIKGANTFSCRVNASHDGTTPVFLIGDTALAPDNGTFDITVSVDINGGNMRLLVTTASGGWTLRARQITRLAA